ncbi:hypothetical protein EDB80DRAFT_753890 [Ilyonectria destructans]|nr:hypothetical protein EDB80DRAFT_753890 [Ilyonectria destructans]
MQHSESNKCSIRSDHSGLRGFCESWYLFVVHLVGSIFVTFGIMKIDGYKFQIGSPPTLLSFDSSLYQVKVTGLLSLALVIVRVIGGSCSALLAWRTIFVLLEKRGISLAEMIRVNNWRFPILPAMRSEASVLWSVWPAFTILLLWPQSFAAPFASSSLSWIPGTRLLPDSISLSVRSVEQYADWAAMLYDQLRALIILSAATNTANEPVYAYLGSGQNTPNGSMVDLTVPYFAVDLNWIDATSDDRTSKSGSSEFTDVNGWFSIRVDGSTAVLRDKPWDPTTAVSNSSSQAHIFRGKLVSVKTVSLDANATLPDGSRIAINTTCPTMSNQFGRLPAVTQYQVGFNNDSNVFAGHDCYIFAEGTITAGKYSAKGCNVISETSKSYADCSIDRDDGGVKEDWLTLLSLDSMSEVLKYSVMMNFTQPWLSNNLEDYTAGMLTVGYHAAWSGLMGRLGNVTEPAKLCMAEDIVSVSIGYEKVFVWLGMNLALSIAAILAFIAQGSSRTNHINDTTLAPLLMDLTEVTHDSRAAGLCSAVDLSKKDRELPRLMWKGHGKNTGSQREGTYASCNRRVGFV